MVSVSAAVAVAVTVSVSVSAGAGAGAEAGAEAGAWAGAWAGAGFIVVSEHDSAIFICCPALLVQPDKECGVKAADKLRVIDFDAASNCNRSLELAQRDHILAAIQDRVNTIMV